MSPNDISFIFWISVQLKSTCPDNRQLLVSDSQMSLTIAFRGTIMAAMSGNSPFASFAIISVRDVVVSTNVIKRLTEPLKFANFSFLCSFSSLRLSIIFNSSDFPLCCFSNPSRSSFTLRRSLCLLSSLSSARLLADQASSTALSACSISAYATVPPTPAPATAATPTPIIPKGPAATTSPPMRAPPKTFNGLLLLASSSWSFFFWAKEMASLWLTRSLSTCFSVSRTSPCRLFSFSRSCFELNLISLSWSLAFFRQLR